MAVFYLGLGANIGDRERNLVMAISYLQEFGEVLKSSAIYVTEPEGVVDQPEFLNQVLALEADLTPLELLVRLQEIEHKMGRETKGDKMPRVIDLDILLAGDVVVSLGELRIPHADLHLRNFVLVPLVEIAPDLVHPLLGKTVKELQNDLKAPKKVVLWKN